jgi:hypothetical protein
VTTAIPLPDTFREGRTGGEPNDPYSAPLHDGISISPLEVSQKLSWWYRKSVQFYAVSEGQYVVTELYILGPLPILAAICRESALVETINTPVDWDEQQCTLSRVNEL